MTTTTSPTTQVRDMLNPGLYNFRKPARMTTKFNHLLSASVRRVLARMDEWQRFAVSQWSVMMVDQGAGCCHHGRDLITIPLWIIDESKLYTAPDRYLAVPLEPRLDYMVAHELAHAVAGWNAHHGPLFMRVLKQLCPPESVHLELGYKPRNASAAGITMPDNQPTTEEVKEQQDTEEQKQCRHNGSIKFFGHHRESGKPQWRCSICSKILTESIDNFSSGERRPKMEHDVAITASDVANAISEAVYLAGATDWDDLGMKVADDLGDGRLEIHVGSRTFMVTISEEE